MSVETGVCEGWGDNVRLGSDVFVAISVGVFGRVSEGSALAKSEVGGVALFNVRTTALFVPVGVGVGEKRSVGVGDEKRVGNSIGLASPPTCALMAKSAIPLRNWALCNIRTRPAGATFTASARKMAS